MDKVARKKNAHSPKLQVVLDRREEVEEPTTQCIPMSTSKEVGGGASWCAPIEEHQHIPSMLRTSHAHDPGSLSRKNLHG